MNEKMSPEEIEAYKQDVRAKEKKTVIKLMIFFAIVCILLFTLTPIGLLLFPIWFVWCMAYNIKYTLERRKKPEIWKTRKKEIVRSAPFGDSRKASKEKFKKMAKTQHQAQSTRTDMNLAQNVIASYALGKVANTVLNAGDKGQGIRRNPNTERYAAQDYFSKPVEIRNLSMRRKLTRENVRFRNGGNGYIETMSNGAQYLVGAGLRRIGHYDPMRNETFDERGRSVGKGNLLKSLL